MRHHGSSSNTKPRASQADLLWCARGARRRRIHGADEERFARRTARRSCAAGATVNRSAPGMCKGPPTMIDQTQFILGPGATAAGRRAPRCVLDCRPVNPQFVGEPTAPPFCAPASQSRTMGAAGGGWLVSEMPDALPGWPSGGCRAAISMPTSVTRPRRAILRGRRYAFPDGRPVTGGWAWLFGVYVRRIGLVERGRGSDPSPAACWNDEAPSGPARTARRD